MRTLTLTLVLGAALAGCEEELTCTTEAVYSATVTVEDDNGDPVPDADVQYRAGEGDLMPCDELSDGAYACAPEVSGPVTVVVTSGEVTEEVDFDIDADECHVIPQSDTVTLSL